MALASIQVCRDWELQLRLAAASLLYMAEMKLSAGMSEGIPGRFNPSVGKLP